MRRTAREVSFGHHSIHELASGVRIDKSASSVGHQEPLSCAVLDHLLHLLALQ